MPTGDRYFRQVTATVMRWYVELEDGIIPGAAFDTRVLDYRIDIDRVVNNFDPPDREIILYIHRDGLTHNDALTHAGIAHDRPDVYVAGLEARLGRLFEKKRLSDIQMYLAPRRSS